MGFTNQTTHYGLPLPLASDKSTFLDTNQSFENVDSTLYEAVTNARAAVTSLGEISLDVNQLKASVLNVNTDMSQLQSRQTITENNVTGLLSDMDTAQADITKLQSDYNKHNESVTVTGTPTEAFASIFAKFSTLINPARINKNTILLLRTDDTYATILPITTIITTEPDVYVFNNFFVVASSGEYLTKVREYHISTEPSRTRVYEYDIVNKTRTNQGSDVTGGTYGLVLELFYND